MGRGQLKIILMIILAEPIHFMNEKIETPLIEKQLPTNLKKLNSQGST